jgi:methyl-coenzyme M reductase gamma subunit
MAYKPQFGPGTTSIAENRRKYMNPGYKLQKIRDVTDEDIVFLMGHRAPGSAYPTAHPPLAEAGEPKCPIRKIVAPLDGAKAGDRVRYIQFTDSMWFAPCHPYLRSYLESIRYRGVDPGTLSGRQIVECRERDLEKIAKELVETELLDAARTGIRGATVHGHSLRLDENGMMFDMLQRRIFDAKSKTVKYVKNQIGEPLDKAIDLGKPQDEKWLKAHTTIYNCNGGIAFRDDKEYVEWVQRVHSLRTKYGAMPME